jgi:hypothetical protein
MGVTGEVVIHQQGEAGLEHQIEAAGVVPAARDRRSRLLVLRGRSVSSARADAGISATAAARPS